jgi:hypothetical protein
MKVEVLYVAECPSHPAAVKLVRDVLNSESVVAEVREVQVRDDSMAREFTLSCRLYPGSAEIGLPPIEMVRRAVVRAREGNAS